MNENIKSNYLRDIISTRKTKASFFGFQESRSLAERRNHGKVKSTLFSRGRRTKSFFTEDSQLYITPFERELVKAGMAIDKSTDRLDNVSLRVIKEYAKYRPEQKDFLHLMFLRRYQEIKDTLSRDPQNLVPNLSLARAWNVSIIGAILLGMVSMAFIYRFLGQGVSAESVLVENNEVAKIEYRETTSRKDTAKVLGIDNINDSSDYIGELIGELKRAKKEEFEDKIKEMVEGYPIEEMVPYIAEKDKIVAAFLIGIAKKESNWGKRVPVLNGQDCYNYWGYKGKRKYMGTGGHTCFNSRKDAVDTVAKRIEWLTKNKKLDTPAEMIIWKCGSSCDGHSRESVQKWISDVNIYFKKLNED